MHFRIGINLGDVIVEGDNLLGDGINRPSQCLILDVRRRHDSPAKRGALAAVALGSIDIQDSHDAGCVRSNS